MEFAISDGQHIYRQLFEQIKQKIASGEIKPGDKLPTERDLSIRLNIARGTVQKTYEMLVKESIVEKIHGSGCYVRKLPQTGAKSKGEPRAEYPQQKVRVAFVDCNLESLALFKQQLNGIANVSLSLFLLDAVKMDDDPQSIFDTFDLVLTTFSHYDELCGYLPRFSGMLIKAAVAPCQRTIVDIATIPAGASIGVVCRNNRFLSIMKGNLADLLPSNNKILSLFEEDYVTMLESIHEVDVIIAAPDSIIFDSKIAESTGKRIIPFNYQVERGSMAYIEEQVKQIYNNKLVSCGIKTASYY